MNRDKKLDAYLHQTSTGNKFAKIIESAKGRFLDTFCAKIDELRRHESNLY